MVHQILVYQKLSIVLPISLDILALNSNDFIKCWLRNIKNVVLTVGLKSYGARHCCPSTIDTSKIFLPARYCYQ